MNSKRTSLMTTFAEQAKDYDRRGDVVLRTQAANSWRELATAKEAAIASDYLIWTGRSRRNRLYVTAQDGQESVRVALNPEAAIEINDRRWATGVTMDRCWMGKGRVIAQSYSIWDDGSGQCVGTRYQIISEPDEVLRFCHKAEIEPPSWIQAQEV